ncbi:ead/Ea22-like family protein [Burkholderia glumae]|uniref:ead/Ea22-like family protein n=1 Tax=Burkholderia glumae TaxID=337 RepID=UPI002151833A|nr:ead/Ea22-like family protein [Burkholderia glumae]
MEKIISNYDALQAAAEKATKGTWINVGAWVENENDELKDICDCRPNGNEDYEQALLDAAYIALANPDTILRLLREQRASPQENAADVAGAATTARYSLKDIARQCARRSAERHDYLPFDTASERAFKPHAWVLEAMRAAINFDRKMNRAAVSPVMASEHFYAGVCVSLQVITSFYDGVMWADLVRACGVDALLQYAAHIEPQEWELAGFQKYALNELGKAKPEPVALRASQATTPTNAREVGPHGYLHRDGEYFLRKNLKGEWPGALPLYADPIAARAASLTIDQRAMLTQAADFLEQKHSRLADITLRGLLHQSAHSKGGA